MSLLDIELAQEILKIALAKGGAYADIVVQSNEIIRVKYDDGKVEDISSGLEAGAGVRVIKGDLVAYAHTDVLDFEHLQRAADTVSRAISDYRSDTVLSIEPAGSEPAKIKPVVSIEGVEIEKLAGILAGCDESVRMLGDEIKQVTLVHDGLVERELLVCSTGEIREKMNARTRFIAQVVAERQGLRQTGLEAPGKLSCDSFYEEIDPVEVSRKAGNRAIAMLSARPSPAGRMPVVMNVGTGGVLFHEACGHGLEADHIQKGASVYRDRIGDKVAAGIVTVVDNPTVPGLWGSYEFDDEGTASQETVLIEDGVLKGYLYSKHEAMKDGITSTGNGRRESFRSTPIVRMSNTYVKPGKQQPAEIIASTKKGLFAKKLGGGQVDPTTGDYVFAVSEGYLIENGELGDAVRGAILIGNGPATLEIIDAVGDDLSFEEGTCGKEGQGVPVTTGGPTFRIAELTVGGTEV